MSYNKFETDPFMTYPFSFKIWLNQAMIACIKKSPQMIISLYKFKVEIISKDSLDLIPSPSVNFKTWAGKFAWGVKAKLAGHCQQTFETKKFVVIAQQCFALLPRVNFFAHNLNFHRWWRSWDRIQAIFLKLAYFKYILILVLYRNLQWRNPWLVSNWERAEVWHQKG